MNNRSGLFAPRDDKDAKFIKLSRQLDLRQHYIKGPVASWLKEDPNKRIPILEQALNDSFSPDSPSYAALPPIFGIIFSDPQKYLGKADVDDPAKTIRTLAEQASSTAITEYMNTHPEYEEKVLSERKNNAENEKLVKQALNSALASSTSSIENIFADLSDDKIQKIVQALHNISQSRQGNPTITTQPEIHSPLSPKVK